MNSWSTCLSPDFGDSMPSDRSFPGQFAREARKQDTQESCALRSTKEKVLLKLPKVGRTIAVVLASGVRKKNPKLWSEGSLSQVGGSPAYRFPESHRLVTGVMSGRNGQADV